MARQPFFGRGAGPQIARMDMNAATAPGRAYGQAFANMGKQIGGMIEQYGLNKEKQKENKATIKSSVGILERMKKLDPENETEYMMSIDQLNNEDMGLGMRAKLADKTLQGLSITSRLQGEMLNRDSQRQALGLAKRTEDLTVENLKLGNRQKEIGTLLNEISLDKLNAIKDEDTRVALLTLKERGKDLLQGDQRREFEAATIKGKLDTLPSTTEATIASNILKKAGSEAELGLMPKRTAAIESSLDIAQSTIEQGGGVQGMAERNIKKDDLGIEAQKVGIKSKKTYMNYLDAVAMKSATKSPQNTSIENSITKVEKEINSIMSSPSFVRDDDGNALDIADLVTIDPITGEVEISEDANKFSKREINRLVELVKKKTNLRLGQKTIIIDGNGNPQEVTIADRERMTREKLAQLQAIEEEKLRQKNEASLKEAEQARLLF